MAPHTDDHPPSQLRGEARKSAIIQAVIEVITKNGASRLTVAEVAKHASASKETVYRHFGSRTGLLIAGLKRFAAITIEACPPVQEDETFDQGLYRLGLWYLTMAKEPAVLSFYRYVVGGAEENSELGKAFSEYMTDPIVAEFERHVLTKVSADKSRAVAETFMGMLQGKFWNRALVEPSLEISSNDVIKQVDLACALIKHV